MSPVCRPLSIACLSVLLALGCTSTSQSTDDTAAQEPAPAPVPVPIASTPDLAPVYFDTARAELRTDARDALKRHASAIQQHPEWGVVIIEGHCDERGSDEYNLVLGDKRALAVSRYLRDQGVPASRIEVRTFGEMKPAVTGHDEGAWSRNRRAEIAGESQHLAHR